MLQTSAKCEASRAYGAASAVFNEYANRSPDSPRVPATERERERERGVMLLLLLLLLLLLVL